MEVKPRGKSKKGICETQFQRHALRLTRLKTANEGGEVCILNHAPNALWKILNNPVQRNYPKVFKCVYQSLYYLFRSSEVKRYIPIFETAHVTFHYYNGVFRIEPKAFITSEHFRPMANLPRVGKYPHLAYDYNDTASEEYRALHHPDAKQIIRDFTSRVPKRLKPDLKKPKHLKFNRIPFTHLSHKLNTCGIALLINFIAGEITPIRYDIKNRFTEPLIELDQDHVLIIPLTLNHYLKYKLYKPEKIRHHIRKTQLKRTHSFYDYYLDYYAKNGVFDSSLTVDQITEHFIALEEKLPKGKAHGTERRV